MQALSRWRKRLLSSTGFVSAAGSAAAASLGVVTELWAGRQSGNGAPPSRRLPARNHAICGHYVAGTLRRVDDNPQYTTTGTCLAGYVVVPNHLGYSYIAERLASLGDMVVSINANRCINAARQRPAQHVERR